MALTAADTPLALGGTQSGGFVSAIGVFNGTVAGKEVVYAGRALGELSVSFNVDPAGTGTRLHARTRHVQAVP